VVSRAGHRISLSYDGLGRLSRIVDSGGRVLGFEHDDAGRFVAFTAPHPDQDGQRFVVARYHYDDAGNLVSMTDGLGQERRYTYDGHLLSRETDRTGFSFHFEYDGTDERARCVHTWGDGGLYERTLVYSGALTSVTNSLGHTTQHEQQDGLVIRTVDALGAETRTEYEYQQPVRRVDALGHSSVFDFDHRGNLPDGGPRRCHGRIRVRRPRSADRRDRRPGQPMELAVRRARPGSAAA